MNYRIISHLNKYTCATNTILPTGTTITYIRPSTVSIDTRRWTYCYTKKKLTQ